MAKTLAFAPKCLRAQWMHIIRIQEYTTYFFQIIVDILF